MNTNEFLTLSEKIDEDATHSLNTKGKDYPPGDDRLSNFKNVGALVRLIVGPRPISPADPALIATVYFVKHLIPLVKYGFGDEVDSEPIIGRAGDAINYIKFIVAIGQERKRLLGCQEGEYYDGLDVEPIGG